MDATPSAAAGPPGNPRGSDGSTGNAREGGSGTRSLQTASVHRVILGSSTIASMLGGILGRGTSKSEGNLWGCDRSRLLGTASALGEALGGDTSASAPGGSLGSGTSTSQGNPGGSHGPSRKGALARGSATEEPRFPSSSFSLEQRPVSSPLRLRFLSNSPRRHTAALTPLSRPSAEWASHFSHRPPASASHSDTLADPKYATEGPGPSPYTIPKKMKGKEVGQRDPTQGAPPTVDVAPLPPL